MHQDNRPPIDWVVVIGFGAIALAVFVFMALYPGVWLPSLSPGMP